MNYHNKKQIFFIIGALKSRTLTLYSWLSHHPYVFMSNLKEPNHFNIVFKKDIPEIFKDNICKIENLTSRNLDVWRV